MYLFNLHKYNLMGGIMYKFKILTVFLLFFVIFYKVDANIVEAPLLNKVIYVDPGHPSYLFPNVWYNK